MLEFFHTLNWVVVGQIILIDILLGGDNAVVIALACRHLPDHLRLRGIIWGTVGAIVVRIVLIAFAVTLLDLPWLKIIGGLLLLWIGVKLMLDEDEDLNHIRSSDQLATAIKTVIVADLVMSVDNVVAVASAAEQGSSEYKLVLVAFGILVSIPIVIWGSTLVLKLMDRVPALVTAGAALLGYIAGGMIVTDVAIRDKLDALTSDVLMMPQLDLHASLPGLIGALLVVGLGWWINQRHAGQNQGPEDGSQV
jgi:YjbE family integral membrane protein